MKKTLRSIVLIAVGYTFALTSCSIAENVERDLVLETNIDLFDSFINIGLEEP